ncbi:hypothetical protein AB4Z22_14070 [Paenibacillus sp. TAF58]
MFIRNHDFTLHVFLENAFANELSELLDSSEDYYNNLIAIGATKTEIFLVDGEGHGKVLRSKTWDYWTNWISETIVNHRQYFGGTLELANGVKLGDLHG